jgi:hypothetical protein
METELNKIGVVDGIDVYHDHFQEKTGYVIGRKKPSYLMGGSIDTVVIPFETPRYELKYTDIIWISGGSDDISVYESILKFYKERG